MFFRKAARRDSTRPYFCSNETFSYRERVTFADTFMAIATGSAAIALPFLLWTFPKVWS